MKYDMKWIEPENGGSGNLINLDLIRGIAKSDLRDICFYYGNYEHWKYPGEIERDADFERIRRIALGIEDHVGNKPAENADPYEPDWSKIHNECYFVATDENGISNAHALYPIRCEHEWISPGYIVYIGIIKNNPDWKNSLRIRPGTEDE